MAMESSTPASAPSPSKSEDGDARGNARDGSISSYSTREVVGNAMDNFSALINNNIIAARYGVFASIALLTAYGISNTPLFFRYRTVSEIPRSYFVGRRRLYCRIIAVHRHANTNHVTKGNEDCAIEISVRHLSPIGMLLPTSWFDSLMKMNPSSRKMPRGLARVGMKPMESNRELLRLQIAGILTPPLLDGKDDPSSQFLERLAEKRTIVSCQLLGRRVLLPQEQDDQNGQLLTSDINADDRLATFDDNTEAPSTNLNDHQVALCRVAYRPHWQIFATDVAEALVKVGKASVASNVLNNSSSSDDTSTSERSTLPGTYKTKIITSQRLQDIRGDVKYLDRLKTIEFEAAQNSRGMWSIPEVRQIKKEIMDEVEFQSKANPLQKLWRMVRGG